MRNENAILVVKSLTVKESQRAIGEANIDTVIPAQPLKMSREDLEDSAALLQENIHDPDKIVSSVVGVYEDEGNVVRMVNINKTDRPRITESQFQRRIDPLFIVSVSNPGANTVERLQMALIDAVGQKLERSWNDVTIRRLAIQDLRNLGADVEEIIERRQAKVATEIRRRIQANTWILSGNRNHEQQKQASRSLASLPWVR